MCATVYANIMLISIKNIRYDVKIIDTINFVQS